MTLHATGRWAKKHKGVRYYFGREDDWQDAFAKYGRDWPYILEHGRPRPADDEIAPTSECTLASLCNEFLNAKRRLVESSELSLRTMDGYLITTDRLIGHFGKARRVDSLKPSDFAGFRTQLAAKFNSVTLKNEITRVRSVFKYAFDQRIIDTPVAFRQSFDKPSAKTIRKARNEAGPRLFEVDEIRLILDTLDGNQVQTVDEETGEPETVVQQVPDPMLKAAVLLGCNCGFGNTDVANLSQSAIDGEWIDYAREKTGIGRRIPLRPETLAALKAAIDVRPVPASKDEADL